MHIDVELNKYVFIIGAVVFFLGVFLYYKFGNQKKYYKKIIDTSTNIVILNGRKKMIEVNKTFFNYFKDYSNLEGFLKEHSCIFEFFEEDEDSFSLQQSGMKWIDYLLENVDKKHIVRFNINDIIYYFMISASSIDEKHGIYSVILSDITEQKKAKKALRLLTVNDTLTNIGNRRFLEDRLQEHISLSQREYHAFSFIIFDIDFFKKINDTYGHDVGDQVLVEYTRLINDNLRLGDVFARVGGEEFVILLPYTTRDKAYLLGQKLRHIVAEHKKITPITMSFGIAQYEKGDTDKSLFKRADTALYRAKNSGRNKVVLG